ncbi:MAG: helix-turn-helix transcriptional regulator [Pedobacter sp.]|nr:helix-turn-helix transcriptional regulator [Pedobacter sp.]MDQ8051579.1 helix-turn-helix transcriptional regulator [Pedobacter sp.]
MNILPGEILYFLRKEYRFTAKYVSDYLSVSRPTYERYEKNIVEIPLSKICRLANLYHIEQMELLRRIIQAQTTIKISYNGTDFIANHNLDLSYPLAKC